MSDHSDFDDFNDDFEEEWDENKWEAFFQHEDEQKRRLQELLDKYGFTEEGLRRAFEELGYHFVDEEEDLDDFNFDDDEDFDDDLNDNLDEILDDDIDEWSHEISNHGHLQNAHPLFRACYNLVLKIMKMLKHINIGHRDHPLVIFQTGLFEAMSKLIRAGYDDMDSKIEAEQGLILAALKRSRRSLFLSLMTISKLEALRIFSHTTLILFRNEITALLKQINEEIIRNKKTL